MSRAGWLGILSLGAGLGLLAFFLTRGLDADVVASAEAVVTGLDSAKAELATARETFDAAVAEDKAFLDGQPEVAAARAELDERAATLDATRETYTKTIEPLLDENDYGDRDTVLRESAALATATATALAGVDTLAATPGTLLAYKRDYPQIVQTARSQLAEARQLAADTALQTQIDLAATSYPEAKAALQQRKMALDQHAAQLEQSGAEFERLAAQSPPPYVQVGKTATAIATGKKALDKMAADLRANVASLSKSIDRILVDMKREDGKYWHKYKVVENGVERTTDWQEVTQSKYSAHREHLGMAIYSKPEGVLEEDATTVASPPGYAYVGNPRYGEWQERNGQSFWVFYGKYALMRDLLWGPGRYSPVYRNTYGSYRSSVQSKKPWYGKDREYGSSGTKTRTRYAGSSYYKQQRSSKYSGSSYQGSGNSRSGRYSGSSYSGSSGSRSTTRRTSSSRRSRYRSSSFGGRGK